MVTKRVRPKTKSKKVSKTVTKKIKPKSIKVIKKPIKKRAVSKPKITTKKKVKHVVKKVIKPKAKKVIKKVKPKLKKAVKKPLIKREKRIRPRVELKVEHELKPGFIEPRIELKVEPERSQPQKVGLIENYLNHIQVAVVKLLGALNVGDRIIIQNPSKTRVVEQTVNSMQIDKNSVLRAESGNSVGLKVDKPVRKKDIVYKI